MNTASIEIVEVVLRALAGAARNRTPLRRDLGRRDQLIADPPLTLDSARDALWGKGNPYPELIRFHPVPLEDPTGPHAKFSFTVTKDEFDQITNRAFYDAYVEYGPGLILQQLLDKTSWVDPADAAAILAREEGGALRRGVTRMDDFCGMTVAMGGASAAVDSVTPFGPLVAWVGQEPDWQATGAPLEVIIYQNWPREKAWYTARYGSPKGGRVWQAATSYDQDRDHLVLDLKIRPDDAKNVLIKIGTDITVGLIVEFGTTLSGAGGGNVKDHGLDKEAIRLAEWIEEHVKDTVLQWSMAAREKLPSVVLYRGTTFRWMFGGSGGNIHDLGIGCYFTDDVYVGALYDALRGTPEDPAILLTVEVQRQDLGRVLDMVDGPLANEWDDIVQQVGIGNMHQENYKRLFEGLLEKHGLSVSDFDTIIGREYVRGGRQFNIRTTGVRDRILAKAVEIHQY